MTDSYIQALCYAAEIDPRKELGRPCVGTLSGIYPLPDPVTLDDDDDDED